MSEQSDPSLPEAGMPRWVRMALIVFAVLVVVVVALMLIGGHGPGNHT